MNLQLKIKPCRGITKFNFSDFKKKGHHILKPWRYNFKVSPLIFPVNRRYKGAVEFNYLVDNIPVSIAKCLL